MLKPKQQNMQYIKLFVAAPSCNPTSFSHIISFIFLFFSFFALALPFMVYSNYTIMRHHLFIGFNRFDIFIVATSAHSI